MASFICRLCGRPVFLRTHTRSVPPLAILICFTCGEHQRFIDGTAYEVHSQVVLFISDELVTRMLYPDTPGVPFAELRRGQRLRCTIGPAFSKVLHTELIA